MVRFMTGILLVTTLMISAASCRDRSLAGTSWRLTAWSENLKVPSEFPVTAKFTETEISGRSAVNTYGGKYSAASDGKFSVGPIAMTEMAGPEPAMRTERTFHDLMAKVKRYRIEQDGRLLLLDANGKELLVFRPDR